MANWIQAAHLKKGALTAQASKSGQSPMAFAQSHKHAAGKTGQRARAAIILASLRRKK
jgi:hypothetical protein